jgi:hypothetical protein
VALLRHVEIGIELIADLRARVLHRDFLDELAPISAPDHEPGRAVQLVRRELL